jgi:hypothetical protein
MQSDSLGSPAQPDVGYQVMYTFTPVGMAKSVQKTILHTKHVYTMLSDSQVMAVTMHDFSAPSTAYTWDALAIDECANIGTTNGGAHAGEPIVDPRLPGNQPGSWNNPVCTSGSSEPSPTAYLNGAQNKVPNYTWHGDWGGWGYDFFKMKPYPSLTNPITGNPVVEPAGGCNIPEGGTPQPTGSGGAIRPTYTVNGLCGELAFHKVQNMTSYQTADVGQTGY